MNKSVWMAAIFLIAALNTGCATIVSGTTQKLSVSTDPTGATATVDGKDSYKTPTIFTLERRHDHNIVITKDGYKNTTVMIKRTFNGMAAGNLLLGGIIGGGIDAASGSSNKLIPERIDLILEEGSGSALPKFASQKDADYYEKTILKTDKKVPAPAVEKVEHAPTTNFSADVPPAAVMSPTPTA